MLNLPVYLLINLYIYELAESSDGYLVDGGDVARAFWSSIIEAGENKLI